MKKLALVLAIVLLAVILLAVVPIKEVAYTAMESYQDTETYFEKINQPLNYKVTDWGFGYFSVVPSAYVSVQNNDTVSGTFDVVFIFKTPDRSFNESVRLFLVPGEVKAARSIRASETGMGWSMDYNIIPETKNIDVPRQRIVWRERPVIHYKKVPILSL